MNPYDVLGIPHGSTEDEAKKAYRNLAKTYHPDNKETGDEAKFKQINEAYEKIKNPDRDPGPRVDPRGPGGAYWADFVNGRHTHFRFRQTRMQTFTISLEEAFAGGSRAFQDRAGKFEVKFPRGISPAFPFSVSIDRGEIDAEIAFVVNPGKRYSFADNFMDLYVIERISAIALMVGTKARIETLHGPVDVSIPPMTQPGTTLRISGKGYVREYYGELFYGDLLLQVEAFLPKSLSSEELSALAVM